MNLSAISKNLLCKNIVLGLTRKILSRTAYVPSDYELCDPPPSFDHIELPEQRKLPVIQKIPHYYINQKPPRLRRRMSDIRGPERIQNTFLYKQFGIIALSGGNLKHAHFEMIRNTVNLDLDTRKSFAVWRVDPPWKPVSKKSIGKRMGGGKGGVHHYVTPVRAGRVIIEVGGKVEFEEVLPYLNRVVQKLPFDAWALSQQMLEDFEKEMQELEEKNINPFTYGYVLKNDMNGCNKWCGMYDKLFEGKFL